MNDNIDTKVQRDRSPSYPAIPLGQAIERLITFEAYFKRHPAPVNKVGLAWGVTAKGSQADQIMAALKSFGLIEYQGSSENRQAVLSDDGRTYLRAQQETIKREVLKRAALKPKSIAMMWDLWGDDRPPDPVCLDALRLRHGFSDRGAPLFLKVYDATIDYAGLSGSDKITLESESETDGEMVESSDKSAAPPPVTSPQKSKEGIMEGERELTTGLLSKRANFRLIVSGEVGVREIELLIRKLELDKEILTDATNDDSDPAN